MKLLPILALALGAVCCASPEESNQADQSDAYCDSLKELAARDKLPLRILADVSSGRRAGPQDWREFKTDDDRVTQDTGENLNHNAFVYSKDKTPVYVHLLLQSPSRDWALYADYCFQPDGSLERISSELRTFYGRVRVIRTVSYSPSRQVLSRTQEVLDLESGEPADPERDFMDQEVPVFWSPSELPFYHLLALGDAA